MTGVQMSSMRLSAIVLMISSIPMPLISPTEIPMTGLFSENVLITPVYEVKIQHPSGKTLLTDISKSVRSFSVRTRPFYVNSGYPKKTEKESVFDTIIPAYLRLLIVNSHSAPFAEAILQKTNIQVQL